MPLAQKGQLGGTVHFTGPIKTRATKSAILSVLLAFSASLSLAAPQRSTHNKHFASSSSVSSSSTIAPSVTTPPASCTVISGQTATFTVAATGTAPLTYQWRKNGTAITGATLSSYATPATTASDNGAQFTVVVGNSAGSATSMAAVLTVNSPTSQLNSSSTSLDLGTVTVSNSVTKSVTLTNSGTSTVTISNVVVMGAGFNVTSGTSGLILSGGQTATLSATFDPSTAGSVTGSVTVTSNAVNSPMVITLSGTGVAAVSYSTSLTWAPSTSTVTGYNVYSGTVSGGPYARLTSAAVPATNYTDSSVQQGQTYYYVVTAVNSQNQESPYSGQVSATIP